MLKWSNIKKLFENLIKEDLIELLIHSKNYLSAEFIISVLSVLIVPIIVRLMTTEEYGYMSIFISIVNLFSIVSTLSFHGAINVNYTKRQFPHKEYLFSTLVFLVSFNLILVGSSFLFVPALGREFKIMTYVVYIALFTSVLSSFTKIYLALLQIKKQSKKYAFIHVMKQAGIQIFSLIFIYVLLENKFNGRIYVQLFFSFVFAIYCLYKLFEESKFKFSFIYVKDALFFGIPLLPHVLSGIILRFFDQLIINQITDTPKTGLYSFAYTVGSIIYIITLAINNSWTPIFWQQVKNKNVKSMNKLALYYSKIIYCFSIVFILFSKEIVLILAGQKYYSTYSLIPIITIGHVFGFLYLLFAGISYYRKKTVFISINTLIAASVNILLNYKLIPKYGYEIAAYTTLISYFIMFLSHYIYSTQILKFKDLRFKSVAYGLLFIVLAYIISLYFSKNSISFQIESIIKSIVTIIFILLIFYKEINNKLVSIRLKIKN